MSKQEAIELFNKGDLVESSNFFKQEVLNSNEDNHKKDCLEYLVLIHKKINRTELFEFQTQLLNLYSTLNENESVINLYEKMNTKNFVYKKIYLESLWNVTNISKFDLLAQQACEEILTDKIYTHGKQFLEWLKNTRKWLLYPRFSLILYHLELGNEQEALIELKELEEFICSKWSKIEAKKKNQKEYLFHIYNILNEREVNLADLIAYKKLLIIKNHALGMIEYKISKKELLSLMILFSKNPKSLSYLLPLLGDEETKVLLIDYIKGFNLKGMFAPESPFYNLMEYFTVKRNVNIVKNKQQQYFPTSYNLEGTKDEYDETIFENYLKNEKEEELDKNEVYFKSLVRHGMHELESEKENLVIAFLELGLIDSSKLLVEKLELTPNTSYLKAEIFYKSEKYTDVIATVNEALVEFNLSESESIPFYYLKAMAYQKMSKTVEAQNILSLISTFNPDFRLLREKLLHD